MEILKLKDWIVKKNNTHFTVIAKLGILTVSVIRNKDNVPFRLGHIQMDGHIGKNYQINKFHEDLIHVDLTYELHKQLIYWPMLDINYLSIQFPEGYQREYFSLSS